MQNAFRGLLISLPITDIDYKFYSATQADVSLLYQRLDNFEMHLFDRIVKAESKAELAEVEAKLTTFQSLTFRKIRFTPTEEFQIKLENLEDSDHKALLLRIAYYYFKKDDIDRTALEAMPIPTAIRTCCWSPYHSLHVLNLMNQDRLSPEDYKTLEPILLENPKGSFTRSIFGDFTDDQGQWLVNCSQHMPLYTKKLVKDFIEVILPSLDWRYPKEKKVKLSQDFEKIYGALSRTDQLDLYIALQDSRLYEESKPRIHYDIPATPEGAIADLRYLLTLKSPSARSTIIRVCLEYKEGGFIREYMSHVYSDISLEGRETNRLAQEFPFLKELDGGIIQAKRLVAREHDQQNTGNIEQEFSEFEHMLGVIVGAKKQVWAESYLFKFGEPSNFVRAARIIKLWSVSIVEQIGLDDDSKEYEAKFNRLITQSMTRASPALKQMMFRQLAEDAQAQETLASTLRPDAQSFSKDNLIGASAVAKQIMNFLSVTGESYSRSQDILLFFISPYSDDSAEKLFFHARHWFPEMYIRKNRVIDDFLDEHQGKNIGEGRGFSDDLEDDGGWSQFDAPEDDNLEEDGNPADKFEDDDFEEDDNLEDRLEEDFSASYEAEIIESRIDVILNKMFLNFPKSEEFIRKITDIYPGDKRKLLAQEHLVYFESLHENFWSLPLELRAYVINELLIPAGKYAADAVEAIEEASRYAARQLFAVPDHADSTTQTRLIAGKEFMECYLDACHPGEKGLILSAVLAAQQKQPGASLEQTVGKRLAAIVSELSPVEKKLAQAASFNPKTPEDIRNDLADITHQDKFPPRWELLSYMKEQVHPDILQRIGRVNNVVGAASFYITLSYTRDDGEERVLSLLRPHARTHTLNGFRRLYGGLQNYAVRRPEHAKEIAAVRSISQSAEQLCEQECNNHFCATITHPLAYKIYAGKRFVFEGQREIKVLPITWDAYSDNWRDMPLAAGVHLKDITDSGLAKDAAKAIAIDILGQCLSGKQFDCDRHTGQYLIDAKTRTLSCFDFGGFCAKPAISAELADISHAIEEALVHIKEQAGGSFELSKIKLDLNNVQTAYGSRVQRGLLTLGSVTESVKLSQDDWQDIFAHIIKSKVIHPIIQQKLTDSVANIFGINKLLIKGALATQKTSIGLDRYVVPAYPMPERLISLNNAQEKSVTASISKIVAQL